MFRFVPRRMRRRLSAIGILTLSLLIATTGVVQAARRISNASAVFGCDGGLCATATFGASWEVVQGHSEGTHYWAVSKLWPTTVLLNARNAAAVLDVHPIGSARVEALNSAGAVVTTIKLSQGYACGTAWTSPDSLTYNACRMYVELPLTVTKLRFTLKAEDPFVFGFGWSQTWTASLN